MKVIYSSFNHTHSYMMFFSTFTPRCSFVHPIKTAAVRKLRRQFKSGALSAEEYERAIDQQISYAIGIQASVKRVARGAFAVFNVVVVVVVAVGFERERSLDIKIRTVHCINALPRTWRKIHAFHIIQPNGGRLDNQVSLTEKVFWACVI